MATSNTLIGASDGVFYITNHSVDPGEFFFGDADRAASGNDALVLTTRFGSFRPGFFCAYLYVFHREQLLRFIARHRHLVS